MFSFLDHSVDQLEKIEGIKQVRDDPGSDLMTPCVIP